MAEVFVYEIEDIDSDSWIAQIAVVAETKQTAYRRLRDAGLHNRQINGGGTPSGSADPADWKVLNQNPSAILRRRLNDSGWTDWEQVQEGVSLDWRVSGRAQRYYSSLRRSGRSSYRKPKSSS